MNIYVGNLPFELDDAELERTFTAYGEVTSARVIQDRESGRSRGFGFVEMADNTQAEAAIQALNGKDFNGRPLTVNEAKPREDRPRGGGGGGGGGGGFGGGGGGSDRRW
jgi:RNA recognition motif-containing protein